MLWQLYLVQNIFYLDPDNTIKIIGLVFYILFIYIN